MGKRKNLAAQRRARDRYRRRLFLEKLDEWEHDYKRDPRSMPTLKVYFEGLELVLRDHRLTDAMHVAKTGEPWPRKTVVDLPHLRRGPANPYPVPHVADVQSKERIERVKDMLEDAGVQPKPAPVVIDFDAMEQGK